MNSEAQTKKQVIAEVFDRAALGYANIRYFPIFGRRLVELADIRPGAKVLDVACGRGATLFPAAEQVGPAGQAIGVDLSAAMAQETSAEALRRGLTQAQVRQMDAEALQFPDATFDYLLCAFSMQFFPHLQRALAEFRRVLKPGGRAVTSNWSGEDKRWEWEDQLWEEFGLATGLVSQSLDEAQALEEHFRLAGFAEIRVVTEEAETTYADEQEWWATKWSISARAGLERLTPAELERFKAAAFERLRAMRPADGLHQRLQAHFVLAEKA